MKYIIQLINKLWFIQYIKNTLCSYEINEIQFLEEYKIVFHIDKKNNVEIKTYKKYFDEYMFDQFIPYKEIPHLKSISKSYWSNHVIYNYSCIIIAYIKYSKTFISAVDYLKYIDKPIESIFINPDDMSPNSINENDNMPNPIKPIRSNKISIDNNSNLSYITLSINSNVVAFIDKNEYNVRCTQNYSLDNNSLEINIAKYIIKIYQNMLEKDLNQKQKAVDEVNKFFDLFNE